MKARGVGNGAHEILASFTVEQSAALSEISENRAACLASALQRWDVRLININIPFATPRVFDGSFERLSKGTRNASETETVSQDNARLIEFKDHCGVRI